MNSNITKLLFLGDYFNNYSHESNDLAILNEHLMKYDAALLNYEGVNCTNSCEPQKKAVNLKFSSKACVLPENVIVSLANNHVYDYGQDGLADTLSYLDQNSIKWFGIQSNTKKYDNFKIIEINKLRICFIGFGWHNEECSSPGPNKSGVPNITKRNIDETFSALSNEKYDFLITYIHVGYEYEYYPLPLHVGLSRYLIDMGSDFIYCSHTHCIQPYEIYKGKHIFYGLGNYYFSSLRFKYPEICDYSVGVEMRISKGMEYVIEVHDISYDRDKNTSKLESNSDYLAKHIFQYEDLSEYSNVYRRIRTRKKNPRPIMYYEANIINSIKYYSWLYIVKLTGLLRLRKIIKNILGWA